MLRCTNRYVSGFSYIECTLRALDYGRPGSAHGAILQWLRGRGATVAVGSDNLGGSQVGGNLPP
jgi:hypothetical protein